MISGWLAAPHVAEWWDDPETEIGHIREHMESISVEPLIVELNGRSIGYLQSYDPHLEDNHPMPISLSARWVSISPSARRNWSASAMDRPSYASSCNCFSRKGHRASSSIPTRAMLEPFARMKRRVFWRLADANQNMATCF